jgi:hypothetical protein
MEWTHVHLQDADYAEAAEFSDVSTDFDAWVCEHCGLQQRGSMIAAYENKHANL